MAGSLPDIEARARVRRRWRRRLIGLVLLATLGWIALAGYYLRQDLNINLRLLWANRYYAAEAYAPLLLDLTPMPELAVPVGQVFAGRAVPPFNLPVTVADVLVRNAMDSLKQVLPLLLGPAAVILVGGVVAAALVSSLIGLATVGEVVRLWPFGLVAAAIGFGAGGVFGFIVRHYLPEIRGVLGL